MDTNLSGLKLFLNSKRTNQNADLVGNLESFISNAKKTLDIAIYDFKHPVIAAAIQKVSKKVKVRIVYDGIDQIVKSLKVDPKASGTQVILRKYGLEKFAYAVHRSGHLMHNKFIIRDGKSLWTGSANFTVGGLELQDNNCLSLDSKEICESYQTVFDDLLSKSHSHIKAIMSPIQELAKLAGPRIKPFFAPQEGNAVETNIIKLLKSAKRSLRIMAFLISDPQTLEVLKTFQKSKIEISGILDPNGMNNVTRSTKLNKSLFWFMKDKRFVKAPTHAFNPDREQDFMHNKTIIIDEKIIITGSYNFSQNAQENDENILIIESQEVATKYLNYFSKMFDSYS